MGPCYVTERQEHLLLCVTLTISNFYLVNVHSRSDCCVRSQTMRSEKFSAEGSIYRLTELLAKDSNNTDPARVINVSSIASLVAVSTDSALADKGHGLWSC